MNGQLPSTFYDVITPPPPPTTRLHSHSLTVASSSHRLRRDPFTRLHTYTAPSLITDAPRESCGGDLSVLNLPFSLSLRAIGSCNSLSSKFCEGDIYVKRKRTPVNLNRLSVWNIYCPSESSFIAGGFNLKFIVLVLTL